MKATVIKLRSQDMVVITTEVPQVLLIINKTSVENPSKSQSIQKNDIAAKKKFTAV